MPLYDHRCDSCRAVFEARVEYDGPRVLDCQACGAADSATRIPTAPSGFILRGAGWAKDGYAKPDLSNPKSGAEILKRRGMNAGKGAK